MQVIKQNEGTGPTVPKGSLVKVHYHGTFPDGKVFDSSVQRGEPFQFKVGVGQVIRAWDEGICQLQKGQKAKFIAPPEFAYGKQGAPGAIPPNATLHFDVEVLDFVAPAQLQVIKQNEGTGPVVPRGAHVKVHYHGTFPDGKVFDSSVQRGEPFEFQVGVGQVIRAWDEGICQL